VLALGAIVAMSITSAAGCGPIEYLNQVSAKAANAVAAARLAQADRYAPYEITAAQEYLHKAREEAGYAQFQDSIEYGRKAEELANRARAIAVTRMSQPAPDASPTSPAPTSPAAATSPASPPAHDGAAAPPAAAPPAPRPETE
jgi:hypothetical protein